MSPARKAEPTAQLPVLAIKLSSLATVLDLPPGVSVVKLGRRRDVVETTPDGAPDATFVIETGSDSVELHLAGVDWAGVRGWKARRGAKTPERLTAEYSVDAHGHRSLTTLVAIEGDAGGITDGAGDNDTNPTNEEE